MSWRCPACGNLIRHSELEAVPRLGHHYRCHICRLELVVDREGSQLIVVPRRDDSDEKNR